MDGEFGGDVVVGGLLLIDGEVDLYVAQAGLCGLHDGVNGLLVGINGIGAVGGGELDDPVTVNAVALEVEVAVVPLLDLIVEAEVAGCLAVIFYVVVAVGIGLDLIDGAP